MGFIRLLLRNALLVHLLTLFLVVIGLLAALTLRREAFPAVNFDIVVVTTVYPGAAPLEVELYVTDLIEEELGKVTGIKKIDSLSTEGFSLITVALEPDLSEREKDATIADLQRAVDRVQNLPSELPNPPLVKAIDSGDTPVIEVTMRLENGSYARLHELAEDLAERIEAIPDVEGVDKKGWEEREFWVEVDPGALRRYNLSLEHMIGTLAARNLNMPGGSLDAKDGELLVRTIGEVTTPAAIESVILRANDAGVLVRVGDVAKVRDTFEERTRIYRTNGSEAINLLVTKSAEGDILRLVAAVKAIAEPFAADYAAEGLRISYVNDFSAFVRNRLGVLTSNGAMGIALVLVTLLVLLSRGMAFVTALGMPLAFLGTFLVMSWLGTTINLISMFGMIIVLGMIVDDAIIVAENIWQHYEMGKSPTHAVIDGTTEVFFPVLSTIATTVAAFSPMLMMSGIFGKFIAEIPTVVVVALCVSLVEAFLVLPLHAFEVLRWDHARARIKARRAGSDAVEHKAKAHASSDGLFERLTRLYVLTLRLALRGRYAVVGGIFMLLLFSLWWSKTQMQFILFPATGVEAFFIRADQPLGTSLGTTSERFKVIEQAIAALPDNELKDYVLYAGVQQNDPNDPFTQRGSHLGQIVVYLTNANARDREAQEIIAALRPVVEEAAGKAAFTKVAFEMQRTGPPVGKPVAIRVQGDSLERLDQVADQVATELAGIEGVSDITKDFQPGKDELQVIVDEKAVALAGMTVQQVALQVRTALAGTVATWVRRDGDRIALRVRFPEEDRRKVSSVANLMIPNRFGNLVPLSQVAHLEQRPGLAAVIHRDERRTVTVSAAVDEKITSSQAVNAGFAPVMARLMEQHPDTILSAGGEFEDTQESLDSLGRAFIIALGLIFLILATQFGSVTQPFVVMSAIPFGIIGVIWAFWVHGTPLSFIGMIGMIGLSGVVINDSIVLVSFLNDMKRGGMTVFEAAVEAGRRRFRAVWLTTLTTIFGLLPLVYGIGGEDKFLAPAALALGYGLMFGTVLILIFIPALYLIHDDLGRMVRWVLGKFVDLSEDDSEVEHQV